jgi:hypothetical protein
MLGGDKLVTTLLSVFTITGVFAMSRSFAAEVGEADGRA